MKLRWLKSNQHLQPNMQLLKMGDVLDTDDLGVSDDTAREWIAAGYAVRAQKPEPIPGPIEEPPGLGEEGASDGTVKYKRRKKIGG